MVYLTGGNGDVKAKPRVAEAIRHQCGLTGVRVGEADNPGPRRRCRTQRLRADDHRNVVQRVDPSVPPDVVAVLGKICASQRWSQQI